jgi:hypothetical protein
MLSTSGIVIVLHYPPTHPPKVYFKFYIVLYLLLARSVVSHNTQPLAV